MSTLSMAQDDHPSYNIPEPTESYAGDVIPLAGEKSLGTGPTSSAASYAVGKSKDDKVLSIGMPTLRGWADRNQGK